VNEEIQNPAPTQSGQRRLYRSMSNRYIAGVCGGMAEYFNVDPVLVRVIWFFSIFVHGIGVFTYIAAWIIVPENRQAVMMPSPPRSHSNPQYILGAVLVALGVIFLADRFNWDFLVPWHWDRFLPHWFNWGLLFSIFIILLGMMLIFRPHQESAKSSQFVSSSTTSSVSQETTAPSPQAEMRAEKRLIRAVDERMIGGVCGGLAKYFNIDPSFVRIAFVIMTVSSGMIIGIVTYIVMMIVVPEENPAAKNPLTPVSSI
jgi:phage shock protein PspC (stress-responsive transcriptional regulator)